MVRFSPGFTRKRIADHGLWFAFWLVVTLFAAFLRPDPSGHGTHTQLGLPPCPSVLLWHRPCPGCGLTTSVSAAVHGDFSLAIRANPFGPVIYGLFTISALVTGYAFLKVKRAEMAPWANWAIVGVLALYLAHGTYRFATSGPIDVWPQLAQTSRH